MRRIEPQTRLNFQMGDCTKVEEYGEDFWAPAHIWRINLDYYATVSSWPIALRLKIVGAGYNLLLKVIALRNDKIARTCDLFKCTVIHYYFSSDAHSIPQSHHHAGWGSVAPISREQSSGYPCLPLEEVGHLWFKVSPSNLALYPASPLSILLLTRTASDPVPPYWGWNLDTAYRRSLGFLLLFAELHMSSGCQRVSDECRWGVPSDT